MLPAKCPPSSLKLNCPPSSVVVCSSDAGDQAQQARELHLDVMPELEDAQRARAPARPAGSIET